MDKKSWFLVSAAVVLSAVYVVCFTDWFRTKTIELFHAARPLAFARVAGRPAPAASNTSILLFGMDRLRGLTEIKVVRLAEWQTNHAAQPLWHLVSDSNSIPIKMFRYGLGIRGMKPAVAGSRAKPLEPGVTYHLLVSAGSVKGQHDFTAPSIPPGVTNGLMRSR